MNMPDLTIIPQANIIIPGQHLNKIDQEHAKDDWAAYGNTSRPTTNDTWTVAVAHFKDGLLTTTSTLEIPQTVRLHPVAGCASTPQHAPVVRSLALVA